MEGELDVRLRNLQVVTEIEIREAEVRQAEGRHDVPDAQEANLRILVHDGRGSWLPNLAVLNHVAEVEGGGRTSAEPDDVDHVIAGRPLLAEVVVGLVQPRPFAQSEYPAKD